jgi:hypothetical protein
MRFELIGMHLNRQPIAFDEGGMPCWSAWTEWLTRHRSKLTLLVAGANEVTLDHINVTVTLETPKILGKTRHPR